MFLSIKLSYFSYRVFIIAVCASFLETSIAEILLALQAKMSKLLIMFLAERKSIYFVYFLKLMASHHSAIVMFFRTFITQVQLFVKTINFGPSVLTVHALKITFGKFLLIPNSKIDLVLH